MKIRIKSNSVRYRLTRNDVEHFSEAGYLADKVDFGRLSLIYALRLTDDEQLSATFENNHGTLHLLIEKDFICLDNVTEDQSDNYPNPLANKTL